MLSQVTKEIAMKSGGCQLTISELKAMLRQLQAEDAAEASRQLDAADRLTAKHMQEIRSAIQTG